MGKVNDVQSPVSFHVTFPRKFQHYRFLGKLLVSIIFILEAVFVSVQNDKGKSISTGA